jgi:predicted RNA-binding protein with PIN domain
MLDWLADASPRRATLRVVFDASAAQAESAEADYRGVRVRFSFRQTADDLIEALIAADPRPADLTIVSNDTRLHEAARRRGCQAWSCERFMDWLAEGDRPTPSAAPGDEKTPLSETETADLLTAFERPKPRR